MNIKTKTKSTTVNGSRECISTAGEIFTDDVVVELVAGSTELNRSDLLLWNGSRATVGPASTRRLHSQAPALPPSLYRATRFPSGCHDYSSARSLFITITDLFKHHLDFPEVESSLLACFSVSTWLADHLPVAPTLMISGPDQELGIDVLRLLSCLCRHTLMLAEVTREISGHCARNCPLRCFSISKD